MICVQSTIVYTYDGLRDLTALFFFDMSFLLRKVEDVTTIGNLQSLTSLEMIKCILRVPKKTTTSFFMRNDKSNLYFMSMLFIVTANIYVHLTILELRTLMSI